MERSLSNLKSKIDPEKAARNEEIAKIPYAEYEYPFENIVFEGGGAKGQVYIGCIKVLEEVGIRPKRIAGTSVGAIFAAALAAGYTAAEIEELMKIDLEDLFLDHSCGIFSFIPNLIRNFGWNPAHKFTTFFGSVLEKKLGNPNVTFRELYKATGIELCLTAVNVNTITVEYFHIKTTPNMSVLLAVRMSLSLPGVFQAVRAQNSKGQTDVYIDGGLLANYPIHAFDGWWLSMKPEDSFYNRLQPLTEVHRLLDRKIRFGEYNNKTLGFIVYSAFEQDLLKNDLEERFAVEEIKRPEDSALYKKRRHILAKKDRVNKDFEWFMKSMDKFTKVLQKVNKTGTEGNVDAIDRQELEEALLIAMNNKAGGAEDEDQFTAADLEVLFGANAKVDQVFEELDVNHDGEISYLELLFFVERSGVDIQKEFQRLHRGEVETLGQYIDGVTNCLLTNIQRLFLEGRDVDRTVGVSTDYIETKDFKMEDVDRAFCDGQGRKSTISFLQNYIYNQKSPKKRALTSQPIPEVGLPDSSVRQRTATEEN